MSEENVSKYTECASEQRDRLRMYGPAQRHLVCNVAAADYTVGDGDNYCRYIECDTTGIFKVDYNDDKQHSRTWVGVLTAGEKKLIANVTKVYRYYVGTTSITAQTYTDAGSLVNGIRLCY